MPNLILLCLMISERILENAPTRWAQTEVTQIFVMKSNMRSLNNKAVELYTSLLLDCV